MDAKNQGRNVNYASPCSCYPGQLWMPYGRLTVSILVCLLPIPVLILWMISH